LSVDAVELEDERGAQFSLFMLRLTTIAKHPSNRCHRRSASRLSRLKKALPEGRASSISHALAKIHAAIDLILVVRVISVGWHIAVDIQRERTNDQG